MDLYFSRRSFLETSFHASIGKNTEENFKELSEVYRVRTTVRKHSIFPHITTIEYVATEGEDNHTVATIEWRWPSQIGSVIEIDGKKFMLQDFLKKEGWFKTGSHLTIDDEQYTWRSAVFRPAQLYDRNNRSVARYIPIVHGLRPLCRAYSAEPGCLHLEPDIATDARARDFVVASFFVYQAQRTWRILLTPWWREKEADFTDIKLKAEEGQ